MHHFLELADWNRDGLVALFGAADRFDRDPIPQQDGCAALFFPSESIRTRITFERGLATMGLQPIVFPPETLDKSEAMDDVAGYLSQWCSVAVVRHPSQTLVQELAASDVLPVVNAMTTANHPCEIVSDLYSLARLDLPVFEIRYVFVGAGGNIGLSWAEAAAAFDLDLVQCSPPELGMPGVRHLSDLMAAVRDADVILTDPPGPQADKLADYQITSTVLDAAKPGVLLNPCPPFVRGREIAADVIDAGRWVGHAFKRSLLPVQQAIIAYCLDI